MHGFHMDWKMRKLFLVREKLGNFKKTGKVGDFWTDGKSKIIPPKILRKLGILGNFYFIFSLSFFMKCTS